MGSVVDYIKCPKCGGIMFTDYNYNTGEELRMCKRCGTTESLFIKRDNEGKAILNRKGKPKYVYKKRRGYGVAFIALKSGDGEYHCFKNRFFTKKRFLEYLENPDIDKNECYLTRVNFFNKVKVEYGASELYDELL